MALAASTVLALFVALMVPSGVLGSANAANKPSPTTITLTAAWVDPEDANGATTNAPGAWNTPTSDSVWGTDPFTQLGVAKGEKILNTPDGVTLGDVSIPLKAGTNTFKIYGNRLFPENLFYGLVLYFDGAPTNSPQIAVYNDNPSTVPGRFKVNPATSVILPGYWNFTNAPGSKTYTSNGTTVEVTGYAINAATSTTDVVGGDVYGSGTVGPDGLPDMVATVTLQVTAHK